jgi:hypothetical protein
MKAIGHLNAASAIYQGKESQIIIGSAAAKMFFIDREISSVGKEIVTQFQLSFFLFLCIDF